MIINQSPIKPGHESRTHVVVWLNLLMNHHQHHVNTSKQHERIKAGGAGEKCLACRMIITQYSTCLLLLLLLRCCY